MEEINQKAHWENVYKQKKFEEVSWYLENPTFFVDLIQSLNLPMDAAIIDVGCGESRLLESLHQLGYHQLTGVDISELSIAKNRQQFAHLTPAIKWIACDITNFSSEQSFRLWHDRAVFHFLTKPEEIEKYIQLVRKYIVSGGYFVLSSFSKNGPLKCSGLEIKQYNHEDIAEVFATDFEVLTQTYMNHTTPFNSVQNFQVSVLKKK